MCRTVYDALCLRRSIHKHEYRRKTETQAADQFHTRCVCTEQYRKTLITIYQRHTGISSGAELVNPKWFWRKRTIPIVARDVHSPIVNYPVIYSSIANLFQDKDASVGASTVAKGYCSNTSDFVTHSPSRSIAMCWVRLRQLYVHVLTCNCCGRGGCWIGALGIPGGRPKTYVGLKIVLDVTHGLVEESAIPGEQLG